MLRKNITLSEAEYQTIIDYALKNGFSFSELLRKATLHYIEAEEELELTTFLNNRLDYVSDEEQREIDEMNIDFDDLSGEELDINDFL